MISSQLLNTKELKIKVYRNINWNYLFFFSNQIIQVLLFLSNICIVCFFFIFLIKLVNEINTLTNKILNVLTLQRQWFKPSYRYELNKQQRWTFSVSGVARNQSLALIDQRNMHVFLPVLSIFFFRFYAPGYPVTWRRSFMVHRSIGRVLSRHYPRDRCRALSPGSDFARSLNYSRRSIGYALPCCQSTALHTMSALRERSAWQGGVGRACVSWKKHRRPL